MKEDFLHYVWRFQKFNKQDLVTIKGTEISVVSVGSHNEISGPDFINAKVSIGNQLWAGNVEIHIKSSDWYSHHHEKDSNYDSVILHVVWEYDTDIFRKDNSSIPTLELKPIVNTALLYNYNTLLSNEQKWIACESKISSVDSFIVENWLDRLYLERLQEKSILIIEELKACNNHWEALLFKLLCKGFGLKVNGEAFYSIAKSIEYSIIKKCYSDFLELEALLFGQAKFFEEHQEDRYFNLLKEKYNYLKHKFNLENKEVLIPKYFRLRPQNFPTIRLSQVALLFSKKQSLFSEILKAKSIDDYYLIFDTKASEYWDSHYNFDVPSSKRKKRLTKKFIDLLLINTVIPLLFCYWKFIGKENSEELLNLASSISSEENNIIERFKLLYPLIENASQSQAILQLKNEYCDKKRCLQCSIGNTILKG